MRGRLIVLLTCIAGVTSVMRGQALPTAISQATLQAGGGVSLAKPDYTDKSIEGFTLYGNLDLRFGLGLDLEYHDVNIITPNDLGESSFMGGLRYGHHFHRLYPYGKVDAGVATIHFQQGYFAANSSSTYGAIGLGGGLDYRLTDHFILRAIDVEYQRWHNFPQRGLSPVVATVGVAYRFR